MPREIHLVALSATGSVPGTSARQKTDSSPVAKIVNSVVAFAKKAEEASFDAILLADFLAGPAKPSAWKHRAADYVDPMILASAIVQNTSKIGVIPTLSSTFDHPYGIARQLLSLDHVSAGRMGWNVVTSMMEGAFHSHGLTEPPRHADRYGRAREAVEIANSLWDSFDEAGNTDDVRSTNYDGQYLRTNSVLGLPRSPQGRPVIVQAGQSDDGLDFAGRYAEAVFIGKDTREGIKAVRNDLKQSGREHGRSRPALALSSLGFVIAETQEQALEIERQAETRTSVASQVLFITKYFEGSKWKIDPNDLDALLPPFPEATELRQTGLEYYKRVAREREDWTIREFLHRTRGGHMFYFVGSYAALADEIERFSDEEAADGFVLAPRTDKMGQLDAFIDHVLPVLRRRGLFRERYAGSTLRDHLGLNRPVRSAPA